MKSIDKTFVSKHRLREDKKIAMKKVLPEEFSFSQPRDLSRSGTLYNGDVDYNNTKGKSILYETNSFELMPYNVKMEYNFLSVPLRTPEERSLFEHWDAVMKDSREQLYADIPLDGSEAKYEPLVHFWETENGSGYSVKFPLNVNRNTDILTIAIGKKTDNGLMKG